MLKTKERIITIEELVGKPHQALTNAKQEPLVVIDNGRPTAYLISVELFDDLMSQLEIQELADVTAGIAQGEQQFAQGAYKTLNEARKIADLAWQSSTSQ